MLKSIEQVSKCSLFGRNLTVSLREIEWRSILGGRLEELRGRSVLIAIRDQLTAAMALIELDGIARRLVICPQDLPLRYLSAIACGGEVDAIVSDATTCVNIPGIECVVTCNPTLTQTRCDREERERTEWILLTSGTTGLPKMVLHTLSSLTSALSHPGSLDRSIVWSTFYDIRRYGGMQILLRALMGGTAIVLSDTDESVGDFLIRASKRGVTHISGTPSHWRRALMSPYSRRINPKYIRLSGEIVDQPILDNLRTLYEDATIVHAFASTEAGVGFEVRDCLSGFPASLLDSRVADVDLKVEDGSLRIRSARNAVRYLAGEALVDADGFVDTRDMVELRGVRYHFVGRRDGMINVGGLKVHPEEIEAVINRHPAVQMSLVKARRNPITGALVVADVVVTHHFDAPSLAAENIKREILQACRDSLPAYKVPASIRIVHSLDIAGSGKLARA